MLKVEIDNNHVTYHVTYAKYVAHLEYITTQSQRPATTSVCLYINNMHLLIVAVVLLSAVFTVVYSQTGGAFGGGLGGFLGISKLLRKKITLSTVLHQPF